MTCRMTLILPYLYTINATCEATFEDHVNVHFPSKQDKRHHHHPLTLYYTPVS
jgi:hypothetical protein